MESQNSKIVDHLFRHQYGKMVAILTRFFGLSNIEVIEDAVQDTFIKASLSWRNKQPENPEAWLTKAAKNRIIDLLRQVKAEKNRVEKFTSGPSSIQLNDLFLDHEIEDSQLRMIFVACHPELKPKEQIAFALKTISGFSTSEIAAALLLKEETIRKRLQRARKIIIEKQIKFEFPEKHEVNLRLNRVLEVIYLTFNEGFHSTNPKQLVRKDLCGEAIRLNNLILKKPQLRNGDSYSLFALLCFHSSRLESKVDENGQLIDLQNQDRNKWYKPLIQFGVDSLNKASEYQEISLYYYEAAIAWEHLRVDSFDKTNWKQILLYYKTLEKHHSTSSLLLNMVVVYLQLKEFENAKKLLDEIQPSELEQRAYLYHGCKAEYYSLVGEKEMAIKYLEKAIQGVKNDLEREYLLKKKTFIQ